MTEPTMIIDPPVGPYDTPEAIEKWMDELRKMPEAPEVDRAIQDAVAWLADARAR
jgi:hypothetical protein